MLIFSSEVFYTVNRVKKMSCSQFRIACIRKTIIVCVLNTIVAPLRIKAIGISVFKNTVFLVGILLPADIKIKVVQRADLLLLFASNGWLPVLIQLNNMSANCFTV